ncbi:GTP cyclohydrolase 1 feedback regulatory protein [Anabarilius grahami]|uniref:GTP cyclohydrolase 1 feedback regulatory protein n=1 Tax=Anabarilius grahami TaxID=495550 RepID=A0A3N0XLJ5_ANAGA|nr:GTP cyclohydrolase 1 feedback regulatory protein [Anabarilius grahami]
MVGDEYSDPSIMNYLGARKTTMLGNNFSEYHVDEPPRLVLDKLDQIGYRVVSMTGVGQTLEYKRKAHRSKQKRDGREDDGWKEQKKSVLRKVTNWKSVDEVRSLRSDGV